MTASTVALDAAVDRWRDMVDTVRPWHESWCASNRNAPGSAIATNPCNCRQPATVALHSLAEDHAPKSRPRVRTCAEHRDTPLFWQLSSNTCVDCGVDEDIVCQRCETKYPCAVAYRIATAISVVPVLSLGDTSQETET